MARDLRAYTRQTNIRLIVGGLILLFVIGDGLIYLFYGWGAASLGLLCMVLGLLPIVLIVFVLLGLEWVVKRSERES